jgi:hypothetical protein
MPLVEALSWQVLVGIVAGRTALPENGEVIPTPIRGDRLDGGHRSFTMDPNRVSQEFQRAEDPQVGAGALVWIVTSHH